MGRAAQLLCIALARCAAAAAYVRFATRDAALTGDRPGRPPAREPPFLLACWFVNAIGRPAPDRDDLRASLSGDGMSGERSDSLIAVNDGTMLAELLTAAPGPKKPA